MQLPAPEPDRRLLAARRQLLAGGAIGRRLNPAHLQAVFAVVLLGASGYIFLAR